MHQSFVAQWHESETELLPFSLPSMASGAWLPTWTPGSKAEIIGGYRSDSENKTPSDAILAVIAVGSILGFFVMIGLLWCCKHAMGSSQGGSKAGKGNSRHSKLLNEYELMD
ncbi:hypothetical protein LEL_03579 [Akanthomyces lecanii RCEF 1005]|uniref:Uncharacterized protein n=1 Tax=Akanthomyces lecanii RCEF 1005 TaxID=1081108 RepID=A0A168J7E4_CORDF|nr:hypothetical protein LEL_03579 [Akanthomyces lecanii RCEF 1005]